MREPFEVRLKQSLAEKPRPAPPTETGPSIRLVQSHELRSEWFGEGFTSRYDWLRGEHVIRLEVLRHEPLIIQVGEQRRVVDLWQGRRGDELGGHVWGFGRAQPRRMSYGAGVGVELLNLSTDEQYEHRINIYIGTHRSK